MLMEEQGVASQGIRVQNNKRRQLLMKWLGGLWNSLLEYGLDTKSLNRLKGRFKNHVEKKSFKGH